MNSRVGTPEEKSPIHAGISKQTPAAITSRRIARTVEHTDDCGFRVRVELRVAVSRGAHHTIGVCIFTLDVAGASVVGGYPLLAPAVVSEQFLFALVFVCVAGLVRVPLPWRTAVAGSSARIHP